MSATGRIPGIARLSAAAVAWLLLSASSCAGVGGLGGGIGSIGSVASIGKAAGGIGGAGSAGTSAGQAVRGGISPTQQALQAAPHYAANRAAVGDAWAQTLATNPVDGTLQWTRDALDAKHAWLAWLTTADERILQWLLCQNQAGSEPRQARTWRNNNSDISFVWIGSPAMIRGGDNNTTREAQDDSADETEEETCKPFTLIANKDGETHKTDAIACRDADGNWVVVEELGPADDAA